MSGTTNTANTHTRREAMRRLGLAVVAAYVAPEFLTLSEARASTPTPPSAATEPTQASTTSSTSSTSTTSTASSSPTSNPTNVTPPTPPTAPSNIEDIETDVQDADTCKNTSDNGAQATISRSDFERAQAAVDAGYAKPLDAIWADFTSSYNGRVIGVEFTGYRWRPRYRFRGISPSGHLETVIVSARTGEIERIVGC